MKRQIQQEIDNKSNTILLTLASWEHIWQEIEPILREHAGKNGDFEIGGYRFSELSKIAPQSLHRAKENLRRTLLLIDRYFSEGAV